jgi:hypothetical protein
MKKMTSGGQASGYKNPSASKKASPIKVSQATIDNIKSAGMSAALKKAAGGASAAYVEGVKRMYGANRLNAAMAKVKSAAPGAGSGTLNPKQAGPKGASTSYSPRPMSETKKASTKYSPRPMAAVKKEAASKTRPALGGFSMAAKTLGNVGSRVERTPAKQKELEALQAKLRAKRQAKKNK